MKRRTFLKSGLCAGTLAASNACSVGVKDVSQSAPSIMTVRGRVPVAEMGWTLPHEHLILDMRPLADRPPIVDSDQDIMAAIMPHLNAIKHAGVQTLVEATATGFGRAPELLRQLSKLSDLNIIMSTGAYLSANAEYVPDVIVSSDAEQLAQIWIEEFEFGIGGTSARPGMIKLGIDGGALSPLDQKIVDAAAIAHLATGMVIGVHISPWGSVEIGALARGAQEVMDRLITSGVSPSAFIWIHAQNERLETPALEAASRGAFVSFDGFRPGQAPAYIAHVERFKRAGLLSHMHLSQDAGWYTIGAGAERFAPLTPILTELVPVLREQVLTPDDLETVFIDNPARAFALSVRRV